ncbi:MAG: hypothetical protein V2A64_07700 [Candidatus Omnitrophota bacterium]
MLKNVRLSKELVIIVTNKIGVLADITEVLAVQGINLAAVAGYAAEAGKAQIMLMSDDNLRAGDALRKAGYKSFKENEVIMFELENKPGALKHVTTKLSAEGVDIKYIYGTTYLEGCPGKIVFSTSDNKKALALLKE